MRIYFYAGMLIFGFASIVSSYADEICPYNHDILEYDDRIERLMKYSDSLLVAPISGEAIKEALGGEGGKSILEKSGIDAANELLARMVMIFEELPFNCAERLVGQGVDKHLLAAGFPDLMTSMTPDRIVYALDDMFLFGEHRYFVKNNERILEFLQREERNKWFFMRWFQDMERWYKIHDFALAAKFSRAEKSVLEEMKMQAKRAYNPLDFALYLSIWQGEERREQFIQLCLELGCRLEKFQECSPGRGEDLWTVKANYIANSGDIVKIGEKCTVSAENNGKYQKLLPLSDEDPLNYAFNFRKIGILNSNCAVDGQRYYIENHDFSSAADCEDVITLLKRMQD